MNEIEKAMDRFYPEKTIKVKSTDEPWIDEEIRRCIRGRKRIYEREKRSEKWREKKQESKRLIRDAKKRYYEEFTKKAKQSNDPALYFRIISRLKDREVPKRFSVLDLFKEESDKEVAEKVADFFTSIGEDFTPLSGPCRLEGINGDGRELKITRKQVEDRLKESKKPKGRLPGDLFPCLLYTSPSPRDRQKSRMPSSA